MNDSMRIIETDYCLYSKILSSKSNIIFNAPEFNRLNSYKVDTVKYLLFQKGEKYKFAFCVGIRDNAILSPFSAPCASIVPLHNKYGIESLEEAVMAFDKWQKKNHYKNVRIILPPDFYDYKSITIIQNTLLRNGYLIQCHDINYAFDLREVYKKEYINNLASNGRKNLNIALKSNLNLYQCTTLAEKKEAYEIIENNRNRRGFPLRMTWTQVAETIKLVKHDVFIVKRDNVSIAAAFIYYINNEVCSVIYWGDIDGYSHVKPINYLSYQLIQFYGEKGIKYLDIGISTEDGVPNYGLCDFKDSIGCFPSSKYVFVKFSVEET